MCVCGGGGRLPIIFNDGQMGFGLLAHCRQLHATPHYPNCAVSVAIHVQYKGIMVYLCKYPRLQYCVRDSDMYACMCMCLCMSVYCVHCTCVGGVLHMFMSVCV